MEVKQNLETARQQLGPDWLQYLVHNKATSNHRREDLAREAVFANGVKPEATEDDIFLNAEEHIIISDGKDMKVCYAYENKDKNLCKKLCKFPFCHDFRFMHTFYS